MKVWPFFYTNVVYHTFDFKSTQISLVICTIGLTRFDRIAVFLANFSLLACVHSRKANALLQISHFAFCKKSAEVNSSTCRAKNFFERAKTKSEVILLVLQAMRQEKTKNYWSPGATGPNVVSPNTAPRASVNERSPPKLTFTLISPTLKR